MDLARLASDLEAALAPSDCASGRGALEAVRSLEQQLRGMSAADLAPVEHQLRRSTISLWQRLSPEECAELAREGSGWPILALATMHRSGHVRAAALCGLPAGPRAELLPFILARANDWVPQVRELARAEVGRYLTIDYASSWLDALDLVEGLVRARRADHDALVRAVYELLLSPPAQPLLVAALASSNGSVRQRCARLLMRRPTSETLRLLSASSDPALRLSALRAALGEAELDEGVLECALVDRFLPVRRRAVDEALRRGLLDESRLSGPLLFDPSASIRDLAREWLRKHRPDLDLAGAYRRAISEASGRRQQIALVGLGESGGAADIDLIASHLDRPHAPTRRFAVLALDALGSRVPGAVFAARLLDPAAPVVRAAADALGERMDASLVPAVWRAVEAGAPFVAVYAARCFARLDAWQALLSLCELTPRAADVCARQLESWLYRHRAGVRERAGADVIARAADALRWTTRTLPGPLRRELELIVRTAR